MKLLFLILLSVFTIESALASPNPLSWCSKIFPKIGNSLTLSKLTSSSKSKREKMIRKVLETHEPAVAESLLLQALSKISEMKAQNPRVRSSEIHEDLIYALKIVATDKTQLALIELFKSKNISSSVQDHIIQFFLTIENPLPQLFESIAQKLKNESEYPYRTQETLIQFFRVQTGTGTQVTESYRQLLLSLDKLFLKTQDIVIEQTLKTQEPAVAESLLLQTLSKARYSNTQRKLIKALKKVAGNKTQSALVDLYNSEQINYFVQKDIIKVFLSIEKPVDEVFPIMIQVLTNNTNPYQKNALEFFRNKKGTQVVESYKQLLLIPDKLWAINQQEIIEQILKTQEPAVAEDIFAHALQKNQNSWTQMMLIGALETIAGEQAQFTLVNLYNSENTRFFVKNDIIQVLLKTENSSPEVLQIITNVSKDDSSPYQKEALQFLEENKKKHHSHS